MFVRQVLVIGLFLCSARVAVAQSVGSEAAEAEPRTRSSVDEGSASSDDARAAEEAEKEAIKALYQRGKEAYGEGDYEGALEFFVEVYERTDHPALLFNIAQAHRLAGPGHCREAHEYYVEYLVRDSQAPNGDEVRERIEELEPCAEAATQAKEKVPAARDQEPVTNEPRSLRVAPVVTAASGAVLLAGIGLFVAGKVRFADAKKECPCEPDSLSHWQTMEHVGVASMVVGGAGVAAGGLWWWASARPKAGEEALVLGVRGFF